MISDNIIKCPNCGNQYYIEEYFTSTCVHYPQIYKDGANINPDRNIITAHYHCLHCGKTFSVDKQNV